MHFAERYQLFLLVFKMSAHVFLVSFKFETFYQKYAQVF